MTNKETIYRQDVLDLAKKGILISNGNYESVCKAINELPSVNPIEPCGDAIDRAEAIKIASGYCHPANVAKELAKLLPVTPQSKIGHWKRISIDKYSEHAKYWYECDKCGKHNLGNTNFCPNCGAKMVEPQESGE